MRAPEPAKSPTPAAKAAPTAASSSSSGGSLDDGALFAKAAAATLDKPAAGRARAPTPTGMPAPTVTDARDTLSEAEPRFADGAAAAPAHPGANASAAAPGAAAGKGTACPTCGSPIPPDFLFCGSCGTRISPTGEAAGKTMFMAGPAPAAAPQPRGKLILIRSDGSEGGIHPLMHGSNLIGRGHGSIFDGDGFLSPRHAELVVDGSTILARDLGSLNGVFVKIAQEEEVASGTIFRIGQELLRFDAIPPPAALEDGTEILGSPNPGFWGRLVIIVGRDQDGSAFPLFGDSVMLGRERGDILFPEDGYVSGTHARIALRDGRFYLADLGSSNGTFLRIGERELIAGNFVLMGQQLFRVQI
jgi:hypothetical protein